MIQITLKCSGEVVAAFNHSPGNPYNSKFGTAVLVDELEIIDLDFSESETKELVEALQEDGN